ncbi:MAG TPA: hypothetical protein VH643_14120 [Gemmataceae bacterium]|jgi:hypothetical protein
MNSYRLKLSAALLTLALLACSAAVAGEIDRGLPANTTAVMSINLKQLLHAPVVKQHGLPPLKQALKGMDSVRETLTALGFDPLRDLDRLTLAMVGEKDDYVLLVHGRFDTARLHLAAKKLAKEYGDRIKAQKADDLTYYSVATAGHGKVKGQVNAGASSSKGVHLSLNTEGHLSDALGGFCITLADKNTLAVASSERLLKASCDRLAGKGGDALNKPMRRLLADLDSKQTIVFAMRPTPPAIDTSEAADSGDALEGDSNKLPPPPPFPSSEELKKVNEKLAEVLDAPPLPSYLQEGKEPSKSALRELSGGIVLADDFKLRCTLRTDSASDAKAVMKGFDELRLRMGGLATLLAGSSEEYAFLKEIPNSFLAVRKGRIILVEGHLPAETLAKLLGTAFHAAPR